MHDVLVDGECITCHPVEHRLVDGNCITCSPAEMSGRSMASHFNPALHPHDPHSGEFTSTPGASFAKAVAHALKDADALDAAPVRMTRDHDARKLSLSGVPSSQESRLLGGLVAYRGGIHDDINAVLRGGRIRGSRDLAESKIAAIDAAIDRSPLSHDVLVYRGISDGHAMFGDAWRSNMQGQEFEEPAYASTTADRRVVDDFIYPDDPAPTVLRIHVPAGTHAVGLSDFGEASGEEAELLLQRGLRFRVVSDTTEGGFRHLDVEVVS